MNVNPSSSKAVFAAQAKVQQNKQAENKQPPPPPPPPSQSVNATKGSIINTTA